MDNESSESEWSPRPGDVVYEPGYGDPMQVLADKAITPGMIMVVNIREHKGIPEMTWPQVLKPWPVPIPHLGWKGPVAS